VAANWISSRPGSRSIFRILAIVICVGGAVGQYTEVRAADPPPRTTALEKVVVTGDRVRESEPSEETTKLLDVPGAFGDPLQTVYSLPGIVATEEIGGAPAVRGSSPEDNSFLIDFLPAGYVFHDFGFSIFNDNVIRDFGVMTAGFGSRYGKATGAIFDVTLREPRQQPWAFTLDSSFLRVSAFAEGQLTDSQAMYVSVRESLLHLLLKLRADVIEEEEDITFREYPRARDFQFKYSWAIDDYNRVTFLAVGAQDQTTVSLGNESDIALIDPGVTGDAQLETRFVSEGINWLYDDGTNHLRTAFGHLDESRHLSSGNGAEYSNTDSDILTAKSHYTRVVNAKHTMGIGGEYQRARYDYDLSFRFRSCTSFNPDCRVNRGPLVTIDDGIVVNAIEGFVEDRWQILDPVALTLGAHLSSNDYLDESYIEPRVAADWQVNPRWNVYGSWGKYHQLPRTGQMIPLLGNPELASPSATHNVLGVKQQLEHGWSWDTALYYKEMDSLIVDVTTGEQYVNGATGTAYGAELMINKNRNEFAPLKGSNRWYGWLALSVGKSERHNELNNVTSTFEYDTPIVANLVANYRFNRSWDAGVRWQYHSGLPYTPIVANTPNPNFPGFYLPLYGDLNSERPSPYHRMDIRVEYQLSLSKMRGSVYVDIINLYARRNGGAATYKPVPGSSEYTLEEKETLPLLPSVGIKVTF
jgi:hypothetical protein